MVLNPTDLSHFGNSSSVVPQELMYANSKSGRFSGREASFSSSERGRGGHQSDRRKYVYSATGERKTPVPKMRYCNMDLIAVNGRFLRT